MHARKKIPLGYLVWNDSQGSCLFESSAAKTCESEASKLTPDERTDADANASSLRPPLGNHGILIVLLWPSLALPGQIHVSPSLKAISVSKDNREKSQETSLFRRKSTPLETRVGSPSLVGINMIYRHDGWSRN